MNNNKKIGYRYRKIIEIFKYNFFILAKFLKTFTQHISRIYPRITSAFHLLAPHMKTHYFINSFNLSFKHKPG